MYDFLKFKASIQSYYKNTILIFDLSKKNIMILKIIRRIIQIIVD